MQRRACRTELERMTRQLRDAGDGQAYRALIYDFRVGQINAILAWFDACEARVLAAPASAQTHRREHDRRAHMP